MIKGIFLKFQCGKGVSLIVVVFAMMLLSMLGWTLANFLAGDYEMNTRNLESEQAFYLADAGIQEALLHLNLADTSFDNVGDTLSRRLGYGEYNVTRQSSGTVVNITSIGYIPNQTNYRAKRQIKVIWEAGGILSQTIGCGGTFNWAAAKAAHTVTIDGDISAAYYDGDANGTPNQLNSDYNPTPPLLPPGSGARTIGSGAITIPMQWYHDNADCEWPPNPGTDVVTNMADSATSGTTLKVANPPNFFTAIPNTRYQAVRNIDVPTLSSGAWDDNGWAVITDIIDGKTVKVDRDVTAWKGQRIRFARRYASGATATPAPESGRNERGGAGSGINYIGATIAHGMPYVVDTVIDLRSAPLSWEDAKIICEGDIFIKGPQALTIEISRSGGSGGNRHPPLATQNGNIICLDATTANNRVISGLIFSETGTVNWNYIKPQTQGSWLRGGMIYGWNIILDGDITLAWLRALVPPYAPFGAASSAGSYSWQEQ
jgi:hypothetical protein